MAIIRFIKLDKNYICYSCRKYEIDYKCEICKICICGKDMSESHIFSETNGKCHDRNICPTYDWAIEECCCYIMYGFKRFCSHKCEYEHDLYQYRMNKFSYMYEYSDDPEVIYNNYDADDFINF